MNKKDLCSTKQTTKKIPLMLDLHKLMLKVLKVNKIISPQTDNVKLTIEDEILLFRKLMQYGIFFLFAFSLGSIIKDSHHLCKTFKSRVYNKHVLQNSLLMSISSFLKEKVGRSSIEPI